jgi:uncharacterized protein with PIN domain
MQENIKKCKNMLENARNSWKRQKNIRKCTKCKTMYGNGRKWYTCNEMLENARKHEKNVRKFKKSF